eukprot:g9577.t1
MEEPHHTTTAVVQQQPREEEPGIAGDIHLVTTEHETEQAGGKSSGVAPAPEETAVAASADMTASTLNRFRLPPPPTDTAARSRKKRLKAQDQARKSVAAAAATAAAATEQDGAKHGTATPAVSPLSYPSIPQEESDAQAREESPNLCASRYGDARILSAPRRQAAEGDEAAVNLPPNSIVVTAGEGQGAEEGFDPRAKGEECKEDVTRFGRAPSMVLVPEEIEAKISKADLEAAHGIAKPQDPEKTAEGARAADGIEKKGGWGPLECARKAGAASFAK